MYARCLVPSDPMTILGPWSILIPELVLIQTFPVLTFSTVFHVLTPLRVRAKIRAGAVASETQAIVTVPFTERQLIEDD